MNTISTITTGGAAITFAGFALAAIIVTVAALRLTYLSKGEKSQEGRDASALDGGPYA